MNFSSYRNCILNIVSKDNLNELKLFYCGLKNKLCRFFENWLAEVEGQDGGGGGSKI